MAKKLKKSAFASIKAKAEQKHEQDQAGKAHNVIKNIKALLDAGQAAEGIEAAERFLAIKPDMFEADREILRGEMEYFVTRSAKRMTAYPHILEFMRST